MRLIFSLLFSSFTFGQSIAIVSNLDTTQGFIGDVFLWTVKVEGQKDESVQFPNLGDLSDTLSIRNESLIHANGKLVGIQFEIMAWDTGLFVTPDFDVHILKADGTIDFSLSTIPIRFFVRSILVLAENQEFRPMKGPIPVRGIFPVKTVILSLILLTMLGSIIWTWKQRRDIQYQKVDYSVMESPEHRAKRRLGELNESGLSKDYYADLSHISREYIETKYFVRALEMTTEEINEFRSLFPLEDGLFSDWAQFLSEADKVKYAREIPTSEKMSADKEKISSFISQV